MNESPTTPDFDWYAMKLGDRYAPDNNSMITRVPGGWLYGDMHGVCLIPFTNEFMKPVERTDGLPF